VEALESLIQAYVPEEPAKPEKRSQAELVLELAQEQAQLWHSTQGESFATIPVSAGGFENLRVQDPRFREWLTGLFWEAKKVTPAREALDRACDTLAAQARFEGPQREVSLRTASTEDAVWVDLA